MTVLSFTKRQPATPCPTGRQISSDPQFAPPECVLAVRALPMTDGILQSLACSEGFTFWGEAVAAVLTFVSQNPDLAPIDGDTSNASKMLYTTGGARGNKYYSGDHIDAARPSRGILCALPAETMAWLNRASQTTRVPKEKLAASILHRHGRSVVAMIQASKRN